MAFVIMCDDTELTYVENVGSPDAVFVLKEGIPDEFVPLELFNSGRTESVFTVLKWVEDRVFPRERTDCDTLLKELGLDRYDAWDIAKKTRGTLMTDYFWLKIHDDDTYEKCSIRAAAGIPPVHVGVNN
jgi:hypothetical protein